MKALLITTAALLVVGCGQAGEKASEAPAIPETPEAYVKEAERLRHEGKPKEAADAALKAFTLGREGPRVEARLELAKAFGAAGQSMGAINEIKSIEADKREKGVPVDEVDIAEVYAQIGDPNAVFRWLERALTANSPNLAGLETNKDFEPVKADPRWQQILSARPK